MLDRELAERFIDRVTRYTNYNVNIMDERGIIIASRDKSRIGQYHEVAWRVVTGTEEIVDTTGMSFPNVLPGINMVISVGGVREGVVGVTGDPDEVRPVALMVKMALETMLKYERQQEAQRIRANRKEHFIYLLTQVENADPALLRELAQELGYPEEMVRIPILLKTADGEANELLLRLRGGPLHTNKDFSFALDERHVLCYKGFPKPKKELTAEYRDFLLEYLEPVQNRARAYIGSFQDTYPQYCYGYRHCRWLEECFPGADAPVFFYQHLDDYLREALPLRELQHIFGASRTQISEERRKSFCETVGALIRANYHFAEAAERLYIHKNTLVYRYNGIKQNLGIDPLNSAADRAFLEALYSYLLRTGETKSAENR